VCCVSEKFVIIHQGLHLLDPVIQEQRSLNLLIANWFHIIDVQPLMNVAPGSQGLASEVLDELSQILIPDDLAVETNQRLVAIETNKI
jgi:hypothetical protein